MSRQRAWFKPLRCYGDGKPKGDADENLHKAHWWLSYALGDDPRDRDKDDHAPESASGYAVKTSREWDLQTGREVK